MKNKNPNWICFQIGAREHYAVPRALAQENKLNHLVTDAWITQKSPIHLLPHSFFGGLQERFHYKLTSQSVHSFNHSLIQFEINQKFKNQPAWSCIIARNNWFQSHALKFLKRISHQVTNEIIIFAYSYAALEIFKYAKKQGWKTILGQIDPGIYEEQLVKLECDRYSQYGQSWQPAPAQYWTDWQQECHLADQIVVNSNWSKQALQIANIDSKKIQVIPLAYTPPSNSNSFTRTYPSNFSPERPLRVLFLGQVILRKGIARIFEAIELLADEAIEFWFVGTKNIKIPEKVRNNPKVKWFGSVSRSETAKYYQQADVFLFPTLSDGFGLTQLEAQVWKLPIIVSKNCGEVIQNRFNGLVIPEVSSMTIANSLSLSLSQPDLLAKLSTNAINCTDKYSIDSLKRSLNKLNNQNILYK